MRLEESLDSPKVGWLPPDTKMEVLEVGAGRRVMVLEEHGVEGWVSLAKESGEHLLESLAPTASSRGWLARAIFARARRAEAAEAAAKSASCQKPGSATVASASATCDKCDGPHATDACPFFKKDREDHKDAHANYGNKNPLKMGGDGGSFLLRNARVVQQPGDGSCLFHSLVFGLLGPGFNGIHATELRQELMDFLQRNPKLEIAGDTLEEWVQWDANTSVAEYTRRMFYGGWGGGIEMACCSVLKQVNVHVYEKAAGGFKRISCFDVARPRKTVHVLYQGRMHYDSLMPT
eukprot:gb/GFBE01007636.1/.p1 GENE.gb/GFBE01007636.1/~~gb/GFBE01007636.1/.p1  ORF type:complete len:292 (+),score=61.27 gb/GFBE01007636.1/:1-876(+)